MNLRVKLNPQQGYNKIFDVGEYGMKLTKVGLLKLAKGTSYEGDTGESEVAFVLIGGKFSAKGGGLATSWILAALAGVIWACQFACQKIGEPAMGEMRYISFAIVMGSSVLFSSLLGVVLGEWKGTGARTKGALATGLLVLAASIAIAVVAKKF